MKYVYKSVKYHPAKWQILKRLANVLSKERGTKVSIPDATIEAAKKMLDEKTEPANGAGTPGGQAQD